MQIIVAVSGNWGIGRENALLFSIPEDMRFFREKTRGAAVIMGRSTLESLPGGRPLKGRRNIIMSTNPGCAAGGASVVPDVNAAVREAEGSGLPVYVIGGESVYRELLPRCVRAYVTKVDAYPEADRFFPDLDAEPDWVLVSEGETREHEGLRYRFTEYVNRALL